MPIISCEGDWIFGVCSWSFIVLNRPKNVAKRSMIMHLISSYRHRPLHFCIFEKHFLRSYLLLSCLPVPSTQSQQHLLAQHRHKLTFRQCTKFVCCIKISCCCCWMSCCCRIAD